MHAPADMSQPAPAKPARPAAALNTSRRGVSKPSRSKKPHIVCIQETSEDGSKVYFRYVKQKEFLLRSIDVMHESMMDVYNINTALGEFVESGGDRGSFEKLKSAHAHAKDPCVPPPSTPLPSALEGWP